jgi:hypothetical protein
LVALFWFIAIASAASGFYVTDQYHNNELGMALVIGGPILTLIVGGTWGVLDDHKKRDKQIESFVADGYSKDVEEKGEVFSALVIDVDKKKILIAKGREKPVILDYKDVSYMRTRPVGNSEFIVFETRNIDNPLVELPFTVRKNHSNIVWAKCQAAGILGAI